jgi:hypothetical protein
MLLRPPPRGPAGGWKVPAATVCADVTWVLGRASVARLSHGSLAARCNVINKTTSPTVVVSSAARTTIVTFPLTLTADVLTSTFPNPIF